MTEADETFLPPEEQEPSTPGEAAPGALTPDRLASLLAYCKLTELAGDPEVQVLIPVLYGAAVEYMSNAGVAPPDPGTTRAALYDLCVNYLVLDAFERRETVTAGAAADNPMFRRYLNQLKWTEGGGEL